SVARVCSFVSHARSSCDDRKLRGRGMARGGDAPMCSSVHVHALTPHCSKFEGISSAGSLITRGCARCAHSALQLEFATRRAPVPRGTPTHSQPTATGHPTGRV